jgi:dephospho-CoA kinase
MARRLRIGLTGGVASGKTTVAQRFLDLGIPVIDADESARTVVAPGTPGLAAIVDKFGSGVLTADGGLDRRALRDLIFGNSGRRGELEAILHPLIRADMERRADAAAGPYIVMVIPLLVEGGTTDRVDRILVVDVPEELQRERVMRRDGISADQACAMLAAQAGREARLQAADDVISNVGTVAEVWQAVDRLHARYLKMAQAPVG